MFYAIFRPLESVSQVDAIEFMDCKLIAMILSAYSKSLNSCSVSPESSIMALSVNGLSRLWRGMVIMSVSRTMTIWEPLSRITRNPAF